MNKEKLPRPYKNAIIYEDKKLYACLANNPIARGHVVVVWKKDVEDLHLLSRKDYEYLMDKVDDIRTAMIKTLKIEKVYLMYLDEICQVHWHLVPRYRKKGLQYLLGKIGKLKDFSLDDKIRKNLIIKK
jgi:diadenosine tetraphosphate (Ap4A) HIT family hydrolase